MQHVSLYLLSLGMLQSDDPRVVDSENILPLLHPTNFTGDQSKHVAAEHDVQQVVLKLSSVLPTTELAFLRSKNWFLSVPALHLMFPVSALAAHIVAVQHWSSVQVAASPGQRMEPEPLRFVQPDEQVWDEHAAWAAQHPSLYLLLLGMLQSDDSRTLLGLKYLPDSHPTPSLVGCQSRHVAIEHDVQQVFLKLSSVPRYAEAPFLRSKNWFLSLPTLHFAFPVTTSVPAQRSPVSVQHVAIEHVLSEAPAHLGLPFLPSYAVGHENCPLATAVNARRAKACMTKAMAKTEAGESDQGRDCRGA